MHFGTAPELCKALYHQCKWASSYQFGQQQVVAIMREIYRPWNIAPHVIFMPSHRGLKHVAIRMLDAEGERVDIVMGKYKISSRSLRQSQAPNWRNPPYRKSLHNKPWCIYYINPWELNLWILLSAQALKLYYCKNDVSAFKALVKSRAHTLLATNIFPTGALCASGLKKSLCSTIKRWAISS